MTATVVFPFTPLDFPIRYREARVSSTRTFGIEGGYTLRADGLPTPGWIYVARFAVKTGRNGNTLKTLMDWIETYGGHTGFLFKAADVRNSSATNYNPNREVVAEAVGTGDGSETDFNLDMLHLDSSTLKVYVDSVEKTGGGVDYTFSGNNTAPLVAFGVAPGNSSVVTADYDYYMPCVVGQATEPENAGGAQWTANLVLVEEQAGLHLA